MGINRNSSILDPLTAPEGTEMHAHRIAGSGNSQLGKWQTDVWGR